MVRPFDELRAASSFVERRSDRLSPPEICVFPECGVTMRRPVSFQEEP
jgi:hypothetical protein